MALWAPFGGYDEGAGGQAVKGEVVTPGALSPAERARMLALMQAHFEGVEAAAFFQDLEEKAWVVLLRDPEGVVQGFSTLRLLHVEVAGKPVRALFSGDTIVAREVWGPPALPATWGRFVFELASQQGEGPLYWFLISKGVRTYRYLPLYFHRFWPRPEGGDAGFEGEVLDALATAKFGTRYDPKAGVVRAKPGGDRLRPELAEVPEGRLNDPHVAFFLAANPGFAEGDELACLAELSEANLTAAARRVRGRSPSPLLEGA